MNQKPEFSSIGKQITLRANLDDFSTRDRLILMQQLLTDFGIVDAMLDNPACKPALDIINETIQKNW